MGLAGLQEKISTYTQFFCYGRYDIGRVFHCWYRQGIKVKP